MFADGWAAMMRFVEDVWHDGRKCSRRVYGCSCAPKYLVMLRYISERDKRFGIRIGGSPWSSPKSATETGPWSIPAAAFLKAYPEYNRAAVWE